MARLPNQHLTAGKPEKPLALSERAGIEWDRITGELTAAGIKLTTAHRALLTLAATTSADISREWDAIVRDGQYIQGPKGLEAHPAVRRMDALRRDLIKILSLLGLRTAVGGDNKGPSLKDVLDD